MSKSCSLCISLHKPIPPRCLSGAELRPGWVGGWVKARKQATLPCVNISFPLLSSWKSIKPLKCWDFTGAGGSAPMLYIHEHLLSMPAPMKRRVGRENNPSLEFPCPVCVNLLLSFSLCKMENTHRPGAPTHCWMQHQHPWPAIPASRGGRLCKDH